MRNMMTAVAFGLFLAAPGPAFAATREQDRAEIEELKRQIAILPELLARIEQLEKSNAALQAQAPPTVAALESRVAAVEKSDDRQSDQLAQGLASNNAMDWARNIKWKGDIRYRHEQFNVEGESSDRVRQRIRARLAMDARISNTLTAGFQIATGDRTDPRSTNVTLDDGNQRKEISLDLAYVDWRPRDGMQFTVGKQKQPWIKAGYSFLYDSDVNPEGISFQYGGNTGPFAKAWGFWLNERSSAADGNVIGAQLGYAFRGGLTLAAGYWDYGAMQDRPILAFNGSPAGNSSYTADASCTPSPTGAVRCYTYDYNIAAADLQWSGRVGAIPLLLFGSYMENMDPGDLNVAYNLGFLLGKAADPHTWEFGALYGDVERDAQFAAFVDSDFADGLTQGRGYAIQGAWAPIGNMTMKATYFINDRNYGTPTEVDYRRLQLDVNYRF
ncbi:MAG: putative porin [Gammaproteobacteria bacterium]|nr:putative porin [Gammaproteobacteria bacterium]